MHLILRGGNSVAGDMLNSFTPDRTMFTTLNKDDVGYTTSVFAGLWLTSRPLARQEEEAPRRSVRQHQCCSPTITVWYHRACQQLREEMC